MKRNWLRMCLWLLVLLCCGTSACKRREAEPPPAAAPPRHEVVQLLSAPIKPHPLEVATDVLPIWRRYAAQRPTLLLVSGDPMLTLPPAAVREPIVALLKDGSDADLVARSRPWRADPLLLPGMTVDAALRAGWFAQLVWALPSPDPTAPLSADTFLQQMHEGGFLAKGEGIGFGVVDNRLRGVVRNVPLTAAPLPHLPVLPGPAVVHIDLSYWQMLHRNERETPLLELVRSTLLTLRQQKIPVLAVTVSLGNLDQRIALDLRGSAQLLAYYLQHPDALDAAVPPPFQTMGLLLRQGETVPHGAAAVEAKSLAGDDDGVGWVDFGLYRAALTRGDGVEAINRLARAVRLDRAYAMEYLALAGNAVDAGRTEEAFRLLALAQEAYPDDVRIGLIALQLAASQGDRLRIALLLKTLENQPWSPAYFPDMTAYLQRVKNGQAGRGEAKR